jgi:hypothetical protein
VVIVLGSGPKFRGFNPGGRRWIFKGDKILSTTFGAGGGVKLSTPCR